MPLQAPINYLIPVPDPAAEARKNLEFGLGLMGAQQAIQANQQRAQLFQQQVTEAQRKEAADQAMRSDLAALSQNMTPQNIAAVGIKYPALTDGLWKNYESMDASDQKAQLSLAQKIHMASLNGHGDIARKVALDAAQANENSGNKTRAEELRGLAAKLEQDPTAVDTTIGAFLARVKGGDEYLKTFGNVAALRKADADADSARSAATSAAASAKYADRVALAGANKADSDASLAGTNASVAAKTALRAAEAGIEAQQAATAASNASTAKTRAEAEGLTGVKLTGEAWKAVDESTNAIQKAGAMDRKAGDLLSFFEKNQTRAGYEGYFGEKWKSLIGSQDDETRFKSEYEELKNAIAMLRLPPGSASDTDVQMALAGMPSQNAPAPQIAQFLRGFQKLQQLAIDGHRARREWIGKNGSTAAALKDFTVLGREIKAGQEFETLVDALAPKAPAKSGATQGSRGDTALALPAPAAAAVVSRLAGRYK